MNGPGPDPVDARPETVVLVDVANVLGSRPDGWWRDRAGAAARLLDRLAPLVGVEVTGPGGDGVRIDRLVAVVEGAAGAVRGPAGVDVVRADRDGDSTIVMQAHRLVGEGRAVLVVTADRGLRQRLPVAVGSAGPTWLNGLIGR